MCAAENIVSKLVDGVLGQITDLIDSVVGPLASFITGLTGKAMNLIGSAFNALNMVMGILTFLEYAQIRLIFNSPADVWIPLSASATVPSGTKHTQVGIGYEQDANNGAGVLF